jgi:hypothetical protein
MTGLPSDLCPECGRRYDARLAALRAARRLGRGFQFEDVLLVGAFIAANNLREWVSAVVLVACAGLWIRLRRRLLACSPAGLWLAILAYASASGVEDVAGAPPVLAAGLYVLSAGIVILELVRLRLRTVAALLRGAGVVLMIIAGLGAAVATLIAVAGGHEGVMHVFGLIEVGTRLRAAAAAIAYATMAAAGWGLWRAGALLLARCSTRTHAEADQP